MNDLVTAQTTTMTSVQLVEVINEYRKVEGNETVLRHVDFLIKIEKELDSDCEIFRSEYKATNGQIYRCYNLPKDECMLMLMSESRIVRKGVLARLNELELKTKIPVTFREALLLAAEQQAVIEQQALKINNLDTVLDNLLDWVSIIKIAKFNKVSETYFNWRKLKNKSDELGFAIKKAESPRYGYQNLYHLTVFKACYPSFNYNVKY